MTLPLTEAAEVLLADGSHMKVVGKAKCDVTLRNGITYNNWPFILVKGIKVDRILRNDLMKEVGALTGHLTGTVYFRASDLNSDLNSDLTSLKHCTTTALPTTTRHCDSIKSVSVQLSADVCVQAGCKRDACIETDNPENVEFVSSIVEPDQDYFKNLNIAV